ncbi:MAG: DUF4115 domain-containing protein [Rubrivivax sp.]|nr:DUF4115 domain-containing protein [Rubrivivax sp.]
MDETVRPATGDGAQAPASAGAWLRAARERQGMHIATLAAAIKVAPRKLEALEQDRWDELPGPTFTRALAQAVCRALKADPQPVMELLPPADTSMLDSNFGTINEPFAGRDGRIGGLAGLVPRGPWLVAALVLLLAAAAVMWWPGANPLVAVRAPATTETSAPVAVPAAPPAAPQPPVAVPAAATTSGTGTPAPAAGTPAAPGGAAPSAPAGGPSMAAAATAPVPAALPAGELVVECEARSWIEVTDALGRVLLSRNLESGEAIGIDGPAPLQVVVGNAAGTRVSYKGKPVDLAPRTRDNVARLELR